MSPVNGCVAIGWREGVLLSLNACFCLGRHTTLLSKLERLRDDLISYRGDAIKAKRSKEKSCRVDQSRTQKIQIVKGPAA